MKPDKPELISEVRPPTLLERVGSLEKDHAEVAKHLELQLKQALARIEKLEQLVGKA